jgi:rubrerythrin
MKPTGATDMSIYKTKRPRLRKPAICDDCGQNTIEPGEKRCPGCDAYREHQQ